VARFLLRLHDQDAVQVKSLKSGILVAQTCRWKRILRFIGDTLIVHPPFGGVAQKADGAELIDDKDIFERMAFLLAAVLQFSISFITRTINRTFSAIMDKRGVGAVDGGGSSRNRRANSSALRAGRRFWRNSASFSAPCTRGAHVLTFDRLI
jgi:hypothetical protein